MRKTIRILVLLHFVLITVILFGAGEFKLINQWKHDEVLGYDCLSFVNSDGHLVGSFFRCGPRVITPKTITAFAPRGQGPNEMTNITAAFPYKENLLAFEYMGKAKIFTPKNNTYVYKETKWFKTGQYIHVVKEGLFFDNKFFLTGMEMLGKSGQEVEVAFLKVYDESGKPLKSLVKKTYTSMNRFYEMPHHVIGYKSSRVFFLPANELNVTIISSTSLEVIANVSLKIPAFYKRMPSDYYAFKDYNKAKTTFELDMETWAMGYSAITEVAVDGNFLVVQVRTCSDELKKFAILLYNIENNFKLEKTFFTDDFLLDVKDGKYYCFANGNPGRDEDTDECIINIYSWAN